jgi:S-DNA-T family DNA segregation ATPase FtsK/SpoIIIE
VAEGDLRTVGFARVSGQRRLVVVGPPGSGRTTALVTLAQGLLATGRPIVTLGSTLSAQPGLRRFIGGADPMAMLRRTDPEDPDRLVEARRAHQDLAVLVDDAERFDGTPLGAVLREITRLADEDDGWILAVTNPSAAEGRTSALVSDLARGGAGVVLQSRPGAHVLGVTLPNRPLSRPDPPGRGWLVSARSAQRIQMAAPDGGVTS